MNGKVISNLVIVGYVVGVLALLLVGLPASADEKEMLPVDAKLAQYVTPQAGAVSAAENAKVALYITRRAEVVSAAENAKVAQTMYSQAAPVAEEFDYEAAADQQAARWQAMAEFYASHGMLNETAVARQPRQDLSIAQGAG